MKAYIVNTYGENAEFTETKMTPPEIKPGHVLIKAHASSLNPVDHKILTNDVGINPDLPAILHMDVSGIVSEVGEGVSAFKEGDEVYACGGGLQSLSGKLDGALADYMLVDSDLVALKPKTLDFSSTAALPLVCITAWEALFDRTKISPDDHVLIHAGTGGVGHIALQLAKHHGCRVATTVSGGKKAEIAKNLGADDIINYRAESVEEYVARLTNGHGFDVVFDTVGGATLDNSLAAAKVSGQVASIIGQNTHDLTPMHAKGLSLHLVFMLLQMITGQGREHHGAILKRIADLVDGGKLTPLINPERFSFSEAGKAHALFASGKHLGKIILENR